MSDLLERFQASGVFDGLAVHFAKTIETLAPGSDPRVLLGAAAAMRAPVFGHVAVDLERAHRDVRLEAPQSIALPWPDPTKWRETLAAHPMVRPPQSERHTPLVLDGSLLYLDRYWDYQLRLVRALESRLILNAGVIDGSSLNESLDRLFGTDEVGEQPNEQRLAADNAVRQNITFITGGPGTGKTTTVKRILALLLEQSSAPDAVKIGLMAPTGKAAARLRASILEGLETLPVTEAVRAAMPSEASTIHRALGTDPRRPTRFRHHRDEPLDLDVVVVDEASMIDLALMVKLLEALRPSCKVIFLGDAHQLQSVEAGAVLGDICRATIPELVSELTKTYRFGQDSGIGSLARAVHRGDEEATIRYLSGRGSERIDGHPYTDLAWIEPTPDGHRDWEASLETLVVEALRPSIEASRSGAILEALGHLDDFRILCAHRFGQRGVSGINALVMRWLQRAGLMETQPNESVGRPLIIRRNDHGLGLYNGDVGLVVDATPNETLVAFASSDAQGYRVVPAARLPPHETVFAMTIHKSQGSQLHHALVMLPERGSPLLTRELLYTAITRARERLTLVGGQDVLSQGLAESLPRTSGITRRLSQLDRSDR